MFPLATTQLPTNSLALSQALEEGLRRVISSSRDLVTVEDESYPQLRAIRLALDGASVAERPALLQPVGEVAPALQVQELVISGSPVYLQQAAIDLQVQAREVAIGQGFARDGDLLLVLQRAAEGSVEIGVSRADLEALLKKGAQKAAAQQGVNIEDVRLELRARSERALDVVVTVRAKKLFLSATVRISGSAVVDEQLVARLSGLTCAGEGALGSLAFRRAHALSRTLRRERVPRSWLCRSVKSACATCGLPPRIGCRSRRDSVASVAARRLPRRRLSLPLPPFLNKMLIKLGFDIEFDLRGPTPMVLMLFVDPSRVADLRAPEELQVEPRWRSLISTTSSATAARDCWRRRDRSGSRSRP